MFDLSCKPSRIIASSVRFCLLAICTFLVSLFGGRTHRIVLDVSAVLVVFGLIICGFGFTNEGQAIIILSVIALPGYATLFKIYFLWFGFWRHRYIYRLFPFLDERR